MGCLRISVAAETVLGARRGVGLADADIEIDVPRIMIWMESWVQFSLPVKKLRFSDFCTGDALLDP
jgi:hypothetical protein